MENALVALLLRGVLVQAVTDMRSAAALIVLAMEATAILTFCTCVGVSYILWKEL